MSVFETEVETDKARKEREGEPGNTAHPTTWWEV